MTTVIEQQTAILDHHIEGNLVVNGIFKWRIHTYADYNNIISDLINRGLGVVSVQIVLD